MELAVSAANAAPQWLMEFMTDPAVYQAVFNRERKGARDLKHHPRVKIQLNDVENVINKDESLADSFQDFENLSYEEYKQLKDWLKKYEDSNSVGGTAVKRIDDEI